MRSKRFVISAHDTPLLLLCLILISIFTVAGCGTATTSEDTTLGSTDYLRLITQPEAIYTIDDLTNVGFKKNKQFDVETVPGAVDIWYGFFQQWDFEVRFYESHAQALDLGVVSAEAVIARIAGQRDPLIPVVNL